MKYEKLLPERKILIAINVLFYQNYGYDLNDINTQYATLCTDEESVLYSQFDDIYAELGYSQNLQNELQESEIYSTSDLIEFILKTNMKEF